MKHAGKTRLSLEIPSAEGVGNRPWLSTRVGRYVASWEVAERKRLIEGEEERGMEIGEEGTGNSR